MPESARARALPVVPAAVYLAWLVVRKLLRISLVLTLVALAVVGAALLWGDRVYQRVVPAVRLVYEVQPVESGAPLPPPGEMAAALRRRIDPHDVHGVRFRAVDATQLEILAPATLPRGDLRRMLQTGGVLSFHIVAEAGEPGADEMLARLQPGGTGASPQPGDALRWMPVSQRGVAPLEASAGGTDYLLVSVAPDRSMTHADPARRWAVTNARVVPDQGGGGGAAVAFELDGRGAKLFGELTGNHIGRQLAIALDNTVLSAPRINTRIGGQGIINGGPGGFSQQEANRLVSILNAGSLPAKLSEEPASEEFLTMTLGLRPMARLLLKGAAVALAVLAALLWVATLFVRRLRPTVADQQAALRSMGLYDEV